MAPGEPATRLLSSRQATLAPVLALVVEGGEPLGLITRTGMAAAIGRAALLGPVRSTS